jgi:hypothetical protein
MNLLLSCDHGSSHTLFSRLHDIFMRRVITVVLSCLGLLGCCAGRLNENGSDSNQIEGVPSVNGSNSPQDSTSVSENKGPEEGSTSMSENKGPGDDKAICDNA